METGAKIGNESMQFAIGMTKSLTRTPNQIGIKCYNLVGTLSLTTAMH